LIEWKSNTSSIHLICVFLAFFRIMLIARFCNKVARLTFICHADDQRTVVNVMLNYTFINHALRSARQLSGSYSKKTYFFFCNFTHDIFPANWKLCKIIPLPKISNSSDFSDYRPIAILPCLSKAFEVYIVHAWSDIQSGFKANHSTSTALLKVVDDLSRAVKSKIIRIR
jgi:hypothetical protein